MNELIRWLVLVGVLAWGLARLLGGLLTPVGGEWRDGDRRIRLHQAGPWIWGLSHFSGGEERYRGTAGFGRVRLRRTEHGWDHLHRLGFAETVIPLVEGRVMARFEFRLHGDRLEGTFQGCRYSFSVHPPRITRVIPLEPTPRKWNRTG